MRGSFHLPTLPVVAGRVIAATTMVACPLGACGGDANTLGVATSEPDGGDAGSSGSPEAGGPSSPAFILGADITWAQQDVGGGATYYDDDGTQKDILTLLKAHGFNYARLRTFVDPTQTAPDPAGGTFAAYSTDGYGDLAHTIAFAQEIKAQGLGFLLDFHYSDYWADPGKQIKPATWAGDDLAAMTTALHDYTEDAISRLVAAGARPDMVQLGNEITSGIELTPGTAIGPVSTWAQLGQLLSAGIAAVRAVDPTIAIVLHLDRCQDPNSSVNFITNALSQGVQFDVFAESCYVAYQGAPSGWPSTFAAIAAAFPQLGLLVAEYNADSDDATELRQVNDMIFALPGHQGAGTFIWEPTHSGAWGPGLFTVSGTKYSTVAASIDQYDQMKTAYGL
jgi:arabinogalactan endo-1,4-beta-galactosidase